MAPPPGKPLPPQAPIGLAPKALVKALTDFGPPIMKTKFIHNGSTEERFQMPGDDNHAGIHDPHREGRAVDIVLLAGHPTQRAEADELVQLFLRMADVIQWGTLIYNKREWSASGAETPRIYRPMKPDEKPAKYALDKMSFEHITHIHIDWPNNKKDLTDFVDPLVAELTCEEGGLLNDMDGTPNILDGLWDADIGGGGWKGIFKFTRGGRASWANSPGAPPGGNGSWSIGANRALTWSFGGGDIRTFVTSIPLDPTGADGQILPQGQGDFTMSKRS